MNPENKIARILRNSGPARVLVPMGIILIIFGIILLGFNTDKYVETVGRITSVTEGDYDQDNNQQQYDVNFSYTVDGKEYDSTFPNLTGKFNVGDEIKVFYDPDEPTKVTNSKAGGFIGPIAIALGALAAGFGIYKTVKAFRKSRELDEALPGGKFPTEQFDGFKTAPGVTEYYFQWDGQSFKPGYIIEDAQRNVLFEGKMVKQALVGARVFEFNDHTTGDVREHDVGHTTTQNFNNEFFSAKSWFKFDGENIWDVLHGRGLRMATDMRSKFPYMLYNVVKDGAAYARIENSSVYVHEEDQAEHKIAIPTGGMYYRFWTNSKDFETLFLIMFAITETEQAVVE
ncbi:MAG: DUF3592 domain-containing protein [Clostridia bacterium]|nr:DUF3592 domain-containing protein [Clostridia bacterium]